MKKIIALFLLICSVSFAQDSNIRAPKFQNTPNLAPVSGSRVAFTVTDPSGAAGSKVYNMTLAQAKEWLLLCDPTLTSFVFSEAELITAAADPNIEEIIVCGTVSITGNLSISGKRVLVPKGSFFDISGGFDLMIEGLIAGIHQIFTPVTTVPTTNIKVFSEDRFIYPQWWDGRIPAPGIDSHPAIQSAINSNEPLVTEHVGSQIYLKRGIYEIYSTIDMDTPIIIRGENVFSTIVRAVDPGGGYTGNSVFEMSGEVDSLISLRADANGVAIYGVEAVANTSEQAGLYRVRISGFTDTGFIIPDGQSGSPALVDVYFVEPGIVGTTAVNLGINTSQVSMDDCTIIAPDARRYAIGVHARGTGGFFARNVNVENADISFNINVAGTPHSAAVLLGCTGKDFNDTTGVAFRFAGINLAWSLISCKGRQEPFLPAPVVGGLITDANRSAHNRDFPDAVNNRVVTAFRGASTDQVAPYFPSTANMWAGDNTNAYRLTGSVGVGAAPTRKFEVSDSTATGGIITAMSTFNNPGAFGILSAYKQKGAGAAAVNDEANLIFEHKNASGTRVEYASIAGGINAATAGAHNGYLSFETTNAGTIRQERMRIKNDGDVGIGTNAPGVRLHVAGGDARFEGDAEIQDRLLQTQGPDVASGTNITLGDGNYFDITGTTQIDTIAITGWTAGSVVILQFDGAVTVGHNQAGTGARILLGGGAFTSSTGDTLTLVFDGNTWRETSRTVIP